MLKFAEYRKIVCEESEPSPVIPELEKLIDLFVSKLKKQIIYAPDADRGVWDRMKNWWSNVWHGRTNQVNPYYWQNKLGDTMAKTEATVMPLDHYMILHECAVQLEEALPLGTEKFQIVKTIDNWASQFKRAVINLVQKHNATVPPPVLEKPAVSPVLEKPAPEAESAPEAEKPMRIADIDPAKVGIPPEAADPLADKRKQIKDELESAKGALPQKVYDTLNSDIEKGDDHRLDIVKIFLDKRVNAEKPADLPQEEVDDVSPPNTESKQWSELTAHEKQEWDDAGGGNAGDASLHARHHHNIKTLPWIVRIGDPRLAAIEAIPGRGLYNRLVRQKRIESQKNPITSSAQLSQAVEEAKKLAGEEATKTSESRKERHQKRISNAAMKSQPPEELQSPEELREPPEEPITAKEEEPGIKPPRVAKMDVPGATETNLSTPSQEELQQDLEDIKDITHEMVYSQIKKWVENGSPKSLRKAADSIAAIKDHHKAEQESEPGEPPARSGGLKNFENTIPEITAMTINKFRKKARQ